MSSMCPIATRSRTPQSPPYSQTPSQPSQILQEVGARGMASTELVFEIPFRRTTPLFLSAAIKSYISSKYDQHPDMFKVDLETIDKLRAEASNVQETHVSGLVKLGRYAAQLRRISGKFPIDIGADFTWYPALGYNTQKPIIQNNLQFEWANVLYNLASLHSKLGAASPRTTTQGLKAACNYFACAAGVIKYLKEEVIPELRSSPPEDMDASTLESLEKLMLAQSQECYWQKAAVDEKADSIIARLAEQVSEYFKLAEESGTKSNGISSEWIHRISAKRYHLAAAAQYRAACHCLEKSRYGEEIARLEAALAHTDYALAESRYLTKTYLGDLKMFKNMLQEGLKRANKDNNMIYLKTIPPASSLPSITKAIMAKPITPPEIVNATNLMTESGPYGAPLFAKLVPYAVHIATSIYVEKRDRLVNGTIISGLESLTAKLHETQQTLNLPGSLQALEKPLGLPSGLLAHAEEVRQQEGLRRLKRSLADIEKLKTNNQAMHSEAVDMLKAEEAADTSLREKHGTVRWTRPPSRVAAANLFKQVEEYAGFLASADQSDKLVQDKVNAHEEVLRILGGDKADIEAFVPESKRMKLTPKMEREVGRLRACLNEVSRLESSRRRKIETLKEKAKNDDINSAILAETAQLEQQYPYTKIEPAAFDSLFEERLQTLYGTDQASLATESTNQESLIQRLTDANTAFVTARNSAGSAGSEREKALQFLENGYFKYREIVENLDVGRKFYNDLSKLMSRLIEEVKTYETNRRQEARALEEELMPGLPPSAALTGRVAGLRISGAGGGQGRVVLPPPSSSSSSTPQSSPRPYLQQQSSPVRRTTRQYQQPPPSSPPQAPSSPLSSPSPPSSPPVAPASYSTLRSSTDSRKWTPAPPQPAPSTPLPAPLPTRVIPQPQVSTPPPRQQPVSGLWQGNGVTPIRFSGEPASSGKGKGKW